MMIRIIPTDFVTTDIREDVELDEVLYTLRIAWNARDRAFYISIADADGAIVEGVRLVRDYDLLQIYKYNRLPPGDFRIIDRQADPRTGEITPDSIGSRFVLVYITGG